jgi:hypothetical protein
VVGPHASAGEVSAGGASEVWSWEEELREVLVLAAAEESLRAEGKDVEGPPVPSWGRVDEHGRLWVPLGMGAPEGWVPRLVHLEVPMPPAVVALPLLEQPGSSVGRRAQVRIAKDTAALRQVDLRVVSEVFYDPEEPDRALVRVCREGDWFMHAAGEGPLPEQVYVARDVWVEQYVPQPPRVEEYPVEGPAVPDAQVHGEAVPANAWLSRVRDYDDGSPLLRSPVPARQVAHLIGRRVLVQDAGEWLEGLRAVAEPVWIEGEAHVFVVEESDWYLWRVRAVQEYPLTRVWVES